MSIAKYRPDDVIEFPNGARAILVRRILLWDSWECRWQRHAIAELVGHTFELDNDAIESRSVRVIESARMS